MSGLLGVAIVVAAWVALVVAWVVVVHGGTRGREADDQMAAEALDPHGRGQLCLLSGIRIVESPAAPADRAYYTIDPWAPGGRVMIVGSDVARKLRANGTVLYDRPL